MDEFAIIQKYFANVPQGAGVSTGIGDDCAIVSPPEGCNLVMSIDTMVEGVHFPKDTQAERIGARVISGALSDLAAMGARPLWFTLSLTMPNANEEWLEGFTAGMMTIANRHECALIGGDTTRGPLSITVQVHGSTIPGKELTRSGANPEDIIYVTGELGDGAAALAVLLSQLTVTPSTYSYLLKRFFAPTPKIREGELLVDVASAAIDVSDGLYSDLLKICEASGVGAIVDVALVPTSRHWSELVNEDRRLAWALSGGDDYQLCFTVPKKRVPQVESWIQSGQIVATPIGKITNSMELCVVKKGNPFPEPKPGYDHFGGDDLGQ